MTPLFAWIPFLAFFGFVLASDADESSSLFFSRKEQFDTYFSELTANLPRFHFDYKEYLLTNAKERQELDVDLFHLCFVVEESGYDEDEVKEFLAFLNQTPLTTPRKLTLTHPVCQRALAASIRTLVSAEQQARLFDRIASELVFSLQVIESFSDFSRFKPSKMFSQVVKVAIVPAMLETGSVELIHSIFEARGYEMDFGTLLVLLNKRAEIFSDPIFKNDPFILAAITAFNPLLPFEFDAVASFVRAFKRQNDKGLPKLLKDQLVYFWIRSEATINCHLGFLSFINSGQKLYDSTGMEVPPPIPDPIYALIKKEFENRKKIITGLKAFHNTEKLIDLLATPLNMRIRQRLIGDDTSNNAELFEAIGPLPYVVKFESIEEIEAAFLDFKTNSKIWKLNFYNSLIPNIDVVPESISIVHKQLLSEFNPNPFEELKRAQVEISERTEKNQNILSFLHNLASAGNSMAVVYDRMDLTDVAFLQFMRENDEDSAKVLASFAHLVRPEVIRKWLSFPEGRQLLREHPQIVFNLPTLIDFTPEDCREFGIELDGIEAKNVHSLSQMTVAQMIEDRECLFNNPHIVVHRINKDCLIPSEHWPLVTAYALSIDSSSKVFDSLLSMLQLSKVNNLAEMEDSELLGLVSHWIVHMEWNALWFILATELPIFAQHHHRVSAIASLNALEASERPILTALLKKRMKKCKNQDLKGHFQVLIDALADSFTVSPFRLGFFKKFLSKATFGTAFQTSRQSMFNVDGSARSDQELTDIARQLNVNLEQVLLAHLKGSARKRRVISNRLRAMRLLHADSKIEAENGLDWANGKYPFDDSFLMWLMESRIRLFKRGIGYRLSPPKSAESVLIGDEYVDLIYYIKYLAIKK